MLGKTANGLFWMYRYLERAENTARLIETGQRIALTQLRQSDDEWGSILQSAGAQVGFDEAYDGLSKDNAIDWLLRSKSNPSSVLSCIAAARQNARLVRTALTGDVWNATNAAHMTAGKLLARKVTERDLPNTLRRLRDNAGLVRGVTEGTILRSLSARGGFRMEYGAGGGRREIAQFLILDSSMPRSLVFSVNKLCSNLMYLCQRTGQDVPAKALANTLQGGPLALSVDEIFEQGLHEFLQDAQQKLAGLAHQIEADFRFYE
jgi:uncharacterized alpha-E superfamily protein